MSDRHAIRHSDGPTRKGMLGLRAKMLVYFGVLFVLTIAALKCVEFYGIPFTPSDGAYRIWQSEEFKQLDLVADLKKERLKRWIEERRGDTRVIAHNEMLGTYIVQLCDTVQENMERVASDEELWLALKNERSYQTPMQFLNLIKTTYGMYDNIQIADATTGDIIVSTQVTDLGLNISEEAHFIEVLRSGEDYINIRKAPQTGKIELIVSRAIRAVEAINSDEDEPRAVIIMHINPDDFITPMLHTGEGLGKTGEALLIDRDVKILAPLKYPLTNGTDAQPLEYQIQAKPAVFAARGDEGIIMTQDYRGVPVLAAYRHIHISPEMGWGMVVKQDQAEVFGPLRQSVFYSVLIGSISIFSILGVAYVIAARLSRPIRLLSQTAQQVESGDLDARAPVTKAASQEIDALTGTFNSMIQQVQDSYKELDERVRLRTTELNDALAEKEVLLKEIHHRVKNNMQALIYLIDMQAERIEYPEMLNTVRDLQGRIRAMAIVHEKLYQSEDFTQVGFEDYLQELTIHLLNAMGNNRDISLSVDAAYLIINVNIAIPCGLIINELVTNALKYAFPDPDKTDCEISVVMKSVAGDGRYELTVSDNGVGLPPEMDWRATESLGLKLVNIWATYQLGGSIEVDTQYGTVFTIRFTEQENGGSLNGRTDINS
ncbi:sensor histidine kinase [Candidatus Poribacteria bacterium]